MRSEYILLKQLENHEGYKILQALWEEQFAKMQAASDKAAQRGNDSAWRYWSGQEKGAKVIITALQRATLEMEAQEQSEEGIKPSEKIEKLLAEARGETK